MVSETGPNDSLNENFIKTWTGDDPLPIRALFDGQQKINTQSKLIIQTNNKPKISCDVPTLDRIHFTPFEARFSPDPKGNEKKADPDFLVSLKTEYLHEVFLWMLKGSIQYYQNGLRMDCVTKESTEKYFEENDQLFAFISALCVEDPADSIPKSELFGEFNEWRKLQHIPDVTASEFYAKLVNKGFKIGTGGKRKVYGLRLRLDENSERNRKQLNSAISNFIDKYCDRGEEHSIPRSQLHAEFEKKFYPVHAKQMYIQLRAHGFQMSKGGQRLVHGVKLR
jgi:phage/plasmid-associated DNA primase